MAIPDYQSLMLPVLLGSADGEVRVGDIVDRLAEQLGLTAEERGELVPSGKQTVLSNRVHWAKTYLGKAGLIEITRRGHFKITPRGEKVIDSHPASIDNSFLNQFEEFKLFKEKSAQSTTGNVHTEEGPFENQTQKTDEIMGVAHKQIEASLAQDLLDRIRSAPPDFFERLIVSLLVHGLWWFYRRPRAVRLAEVVTKALMA